jgi:hypothetical protein
MSLALQYSGEIYLQPILSVEMLQNVIIEIHSLIYNRVSARYRFNSLQYGHYHAKI